MKCPNCGFERPRGRPKKLNDKLVSKLRAQGLSLAEIADKIGVPRSSVQSALTRMEKKS